jgi:hypothetical protein
MRVYDLRFRDAASVARAFERLMASSQVDTCEVEPEKVRLRFVAPAAAAVGLLERIYLDGDLTWCSGHDLVAAAQAQDTLKSAGAVAPA